MPRGSWSGRPPVRAAAAPGDRRPAVAHAQPPAAGLPAVEEVEQTMALSRTKVELRDALQQLEAATRRIAALEREASAAALRADRPRSVEHRAGGGGATAAP